MNTLLFAGGSGARVLEALLHLCAAGLGPEAVRLLLVDPDAANGNGNYTREVVERYARLHEALWGGTTGAPPAGAPFRTRLDLLRTPDEERGSRKPALKRWSPVPVGKTLRDLINYDNLGATALPQDLARLFFTSAELDLKLEEGFRGHTAIGSAAMSLVAQQAGEQPWKALIEQLRNDLGGGQPSTVALIASVFGGTGASAIFPLARFLRTVPDRNSEKLNVGVIALVPYFSFKPSTAKTDREKQLAEISARAEGFALATRAAAAFYDHLRSQADFPLDAMFWLGDSSAPERTYSPGGANQRNPPAFVDLLAALATLDYLAAPVKSGACYYAGPGSEAESHTELSSWPDLPFRAYKVEEVQSALRRLLLAAVAHLGLLQPMLDHPDLAKKPYQVPWYFDRFAQNGDSLLAATPRAGLEGFSAYLERDFLPFWAQLAGDPRVRLLNGVAISWSPGAERAAVHLDRLGNPEHPDRGGAASVDDVDRFFDTLCATARGSGADRGFKAYLGLLAEAADSFWSQVSNRQRPGRGRRA